MKTRTITACVIFAMLFCLASGALAADVTLTVGSTSIAPGSSGTVKIEADNAAGITGAAFTLEYDTDVLNVTLNSTFFSTFTEMGLDTNDGLDDDGGFTFDNKVYRQALVAETKIGTGMRIAAANHTPADGTNKTLFTLNVTVDENATEGDGPYEIKIIPTELTNEAAGYKTPTKIDLLIQANDDATTFTPMLTVAAAEANVPKGTITIGEPTPEYIKGDANGDGRITAADALMVLKVESEVIDASELKGECDVNKDERITANDALQILRYEAEIITSWP